MNLSINSNETIKKLSNESSQYEQLSYNEMLPSLYQQQRKSFSRLQIIEISFLCFILLENLIIFIITYQKRKLPRQTLFEHKYEIYF